VQGDVKVFDGEGLRFPGRERIHIVRQFESLRDLAFRVMVAVYYVDWDAGLREAADLAREKEAGLVVAPVPIVEVAGNDEEIDIFLDRVADQIVECLTGRGANPRRDLTILAREAFEGTIEMYVCAVDKPK